MLARKTNTLVQLTIFRFYFTKDSITKFCKGLKLNSSLRILRLTYCSFPNTEEFSILTNALCIQETIEVLEVSGCGLTDDCSIPIKEIIISHAQRRNEQGWARGLREECSSEENKTGLLHLNLSMNKLTDKFAVGLIRALNFDQYIRVHT